MKKSYSKDEICHLVLCSFISIGLFVADAFSSSVIFNIVRLYSSRLGFCTVVTELSRCLETLDGSVSRCFLQMFSHPTEAERRAGQGAVSGRAPQGRWVRKERLNYASKRSGSRAFSRSSRCRLLLLSSSFVPPGRRHRRFSRSSLRFTLCAAQSPRCTQLATYLPRSKQIHISGSMYDPIYRDVATGDRVKSFNRRIFFLQTDLHTSMCDANEAFENQRDTFVIARLNCIVYCFSVLSPLTRIKYYCVSETILARKLK